jgi:hypothetical protein
VAAAIGLTGFRDGAHDENVAALALAGALATIGAGVLVAGLRGRRSGGLAPIGLILVVPTIMAAAVAASGFGVGDNDALFGEPTWRPMTAQAAASQFSLGAGQGRLDLTEPAILSGATAADPLKVDVRSGAAEVTLVLPDGIPARVDVEMGAGEVIQPDGEVVTLDGDSGSASHQTTVTTGPDREPILVVSVRQGVGQLTIDTEPAPAPAPVRETTAG